MKILHTIYDDFPNPWCGGGGALRTLEISRRLADRHDITLLSGAYPNAPRTEEIDGLRILRVGSDWSYPLSRLSFSIQASRMVARSDFDLWVYRFSAYAPLLVPAHLRRRCLLECMHVLGDNAAQKFPLLGHGARLFETVTLRAYTDILTISPTATREIEQIVKHQNLHLVYTGVDALCFDAPFSEEDYILYFGRLDTYTKGLDILLNGFARVCTHHPDIRLVLAGRGTSERQQELQVMCESLGILNRVTFVGPVSNEQKTALFGAALFVCMPSRYEGWGIVAIEAGAAEKAVIGTDIAGLGDAIQHNKTGLLVPPENPEALAQAMHHLLEHGDQRRRLGKAGREWARQFTWDHIARDQERVYFEVYEKMRSAK